MSEKQKIVTIDDIIATVGQFFGIKSTEIRGPSRTARVALARQVVMFFSREIAQLSSSAIGQELGNRHHTTVLHGHRFIEEQMNSDAVLKNQVRQLENQLLNRN